MSASENELSTILPMIEQQRLAREMANTCTLEFLNKAVEMARARYETPSGNWLWRRCKEMIYKYTRQRQQQFDCLAKVIDSGDELATLTQLDAFLSDTKAHHGTERRSNYLLLYMITLVTQARLYNESKKLDTLSEKDHKTIDSLVDEALSPERQQQLITLFLYALEQKIVRLENQAKQQAKTQRELDMIQANRVRRLQAKVANVGVEVLTASALTPEPCANAEFVKVYFRKTAKGGRLFWLDPFGQEELLDFRSDAKFGLLFSKINRNECDLSDLDAVVQAEIKQFCQRQVSYKVGAVSVDTLSEKVYPNSYRLSLKDKVWSLSWVDSKEAVTPITISNYPMLDDYLNSLISDDRQTGKVSSSNELSPQQLVIIKTLLRYRIQVPKKLEGDYSNIERALKVLIEKKHIAQASVRSQEFVPGKLTGDYSMLEKIFAKKREAPQPPQACSSSLSSVDPRARTKLSDSQLAIQQKLVNIYGGDQDTVASPTPKHDDELDSNANQVLYYSTLRGVNWQASSRSTSTTRCRGESKLVSERAQALKAKLCFRFTDDEGNKSIIPTDETASSISASK